MLWRLLPPGHAAEAGASGQFVPGLGPRNEKLLNYLIAIGFEK